MDKLLARHPGSAKRVYAIMICIGLALGLIFPYFFTLFISANSGWGATFRLASLAAGFAIGNLYFFLVGSIFSRADRKLSRSKQELEEAKERFASLAHAAITNESWLVKMEDDSVPTCWRVKDCTDAGCPVHGEEHRRCWLVAGTFCSTGLPSGRFAQKPGNCAKCEVYQRATGNNPITGISEAFNGLMLAFREKEEMLAVANKELKEQYGELEQLHRQAREMADSDLLTGLRNHAHFQQQLKWEIAKAEQNHKKLSLIMLDLDNFKLVNGNFGHQKGDEVLRCLGHILTEEASSAGYAARYGGEEFVLLLPETGAGAAMKLADRIRRQMKRLSREVDLPERFVAASLGVADYPACAADGDSLLSAADSALLFAKRQGRDRVAYFRNLSQAELKAGDVERLRSRLEGASLQTIKALAEAVDCNDDYTHIGMNELERVTEGIAARLGMEEVQADSLVLAMRLHDVGKIGIPRSVLQKKEKLSDDELALVQLHPEFGQRILEEAQQLHELISAILYHHERWDGAGYPEKLQGEQIPLTARIVCIVDAYRAMRSNRPYRKALSYKEAIRELRQGAGGQFDPRLVDIFVEQIEAERSWESEEKRMAN